MIQEGTDDEDGDGIIDYPLDYNNQTFDERTETFSEVTPMASASYHIHHARPHSSPLDSAMVYATWSNGFKSGFFEPRGVDGLDLINPEEVENTELGLKMDALDRSLRVNIAAYHMDFRNMQLIQVQSDSEANMAVIFANAGRSKVTGVELEVSWLPSADWLVTFNYSNNHYRFVGFDAFALTPRAIQGHTVPLARRDEGFPVSPGQPAHPGLQAPCAPRHGEPAHQQGSRHRHTPPPRP